MAGHHKLVKALRDYWQRKQEHEQAKKHRYFITNCGTAEMMNQSLATVRSFSEQEAESFSFRYWYLIHLVFPYDLELFNKLLASATKPHEKLYAIVVGIVYVNDHRGISWKSRDVKSTFHDSVLSPAIKQHEESLVVPISREYDYLWRLVGQSPLCEDIQRCAVAWLTHVTPHNESHRYPIP
jgi:hypothetical protein